MSREIKFRAWLPDMGAMIHSDNPDSMNDADAYFDLETNGLQVFTIESCNDDTECYSEKYNDAVLMQFTGLHDKNGKEIYEGDIVQTIDQMEATYNELDSNVGVGEVEVLHGFWNVGGHVCNGLYDLDDMYHIEVIGNVHENPELLEAGE